MIYRYFAVFFRILMAFSARQTEKCSKLLQNVALCCRRSVKECIYKFFVSEEAMLFKERSNALLPEKHCFLKSVCFC